MSCVKITASDEEVITYLNTLWYGNDINLINNKFYKFFTFFSNKVYNFINPFKLPNIKNNLSELKKIGFSIYNNNTTNNEQPIENNNLENDFIIVEEFINSNYENRINILKRSDIFGKKICYCTIFYKYKKGPLNDPNSFRYFINHHNTIKILDRIWYKNVINKSNNLPDPDIFKVQLIKNNTSSLINIANYNTLSINNVILIDLIKAYDSIEWDILRELLYHSLIRKMNFIYATELLEQYMCIITNRIITYMKKIIKLSKSIPTGLPSSMLVFTFIIEEIIIRWLVENSLNFKINVDFIINIYIDDIYIKILNYSKTDIIIESLINIFKKYKLYVNFDKSRISSNLHCNIFNELTSNDLYLGIPFTRDINLYMSIIINECNKKYNLNYNWMNIYTILNSDINLEQKQLLTGYLNYKLNPILNNIPLIDFIKNFIT